jgi:hypothetical protein
MTPPFRLVKTDEHTSSAHRATGSGGGALAHRHGLHGLCRHASSTCLQRCAACPKSQPVDDAAQELLRSEMAKLVGLTCHLGCRLLLGLFQLF